MGMALALHTISDENIDRVLADPPLIWLVVAPGEPELYEHAAVPKQPGFIARLFGAKEQVASSTAPEPLSKATGEGEETDLDKAWHGIHYLLTGTAWEGDAPLNFLIGGGTEVGDVDVGYGPARVMRSKDVAVVAEALGQLDANTLRDRFIPEEMTKLEIYPDIWERDPEEDDTLGYCIDYYEELQRFVAKAADNALGIVLYIC